MNLDLPCFIWVGVNILVHGISEYYRRNGAKKSFHSSLLIYEWKNLCDWGHRVCCRVKTELNVFFFSPIYHTKSKSIVGSLLNSILSRHNTSTSNWKRKLAVREVLKKPTLIYLQTVKVVGLRVSAWTVIIYTAVRAKADWLNLFWTGAWFKVVPCVFAQAYAWGHVFENRKGRGLERIQREKNKFRR